MTRVRFLGYWLRLNLFYNWEKLFFFFFEISKHSVSYSKLLEPKVFSFYTESFFRALTIRTKELAQSTGLFQLEVYAIRSDHNIIIRDYVICKLMMFKGSPESTCPCETKELISWSLRNDLTKRNSPPKTNPRHLLLWRKWLNC